MNPTTQSMLPPQAVAAAVRRGGDPNSMFQQNPLASNVGPGAMAYDPSTAPTPQAGSQATNPMMQPPPGTNPGQPQLQGQPQPLDESTMILQALQDRLEHHSKVTEKTIGTLTKMIEASMPQPDPNQPTNG